MPEQSPTLFQTGSGALALKAGQKLRQIRERLNLTLRQVEQASLEIADAERNSEYVVSVGRLNQIENDGSLPSIYKLYSLAVIYKLSVEEAMGVYGINLSRMDGHRLRARQTNTHVFSVELGDPAKRIHFPVRFDPGFKLEKTTFLSRIVEMWGEIPAGLLSTLDFKKYRYGFVGMEDRMMVPLLRPGSIVQIDESRRRIVNQGWLSEFDRPIYFLELRYSYECCWCCQQGREVTLIPHPLSPCAPRRIRIPDDGEVLGQVVGVAMRIVN
ncbi:MAG TPA: helix-turn-helix transcriptional regulator [Terriglobia bacterium]|jgi:transcriptional regulator with XRE-family HTH domain|nr:helix-turn-helix transcriptional regulator [Terriglobia bacterium]